MSSLKKVLAKVAARRKFDHNTDPVLFKHRSPLLQHNGEPPNLQNGPRHLSQEGRSPNSASGDCGGNGAIDATELEAYERVCLTLETIVFTTHPFTHRTCSKRITAIRPKRS